MSKNNTPKPGLERRFADGKSAPLPMDGGGRMTPVLSVTGLSVEFGTAEHPSIVVDDLSFSVKAGRTLAIVGESGPGKSITALPIIALAGHVGARTTAGHILFSIADRPPVDLTEAGLVGDFLARSAK